MDDVTQAADVVAHPNAREYFAALGLTDNSPVTAGQVAGLLEYFGLVAQPDTHAPSPHIDTPTPPPVAVAPTPVPVAAAVAVSAPSIKDRVIGDVESMAEELAGALLPLLTSKLAARL